MGLIRTQELLAARRIDGARQFFSRAIDFGFSKTASEALAKWGREEILADTVWVIRKFQPDLIVLRFSGTSRDGHGQHQASALLGKEAFAAAADPARFPDQLAYVGPWQAKRLYWNVFTFTPELRKEAEKIPGTLQVDVGIFDPEIGLSFGEIAGISRSLHRSQGMGVPEPKGSAVELLAPVDGVPATRDLLEGIGLTWQERVPGSDAVSTALAAAANAFRTEAPKAAVPRLVQARNAMASLAPHSAWAARKLAAIDEVIADAAGLWLDAATSLQTAVTGSRLPVRIQAVMRSQTTATLDSVEIDGAAGQVRQSPSLQLRFNQPLAISLEVPLPGHPNQPHWLSEAPDETRYRIADPLQIASPEPGGDLTARFRVTVGGQEISLSRTVMNRFVDPVRGERTRPLIVAPPVALAFTERSVVFASGASREIELQVRSVQPSAAGRIRLTAPHGWILAGAPREFSIGEPGGVSSIRFTVTPPAGAGRGELSAVAVIDGREFGYSMRTIDYDHIPAQTVFYRAAVLLVRTEARLLSRRVGYVPGAGDDIPAALRNLGAEVTMLSPADLARTDLSSFDAIVTGVRAYNVHKELRANQSRLLEYVERGGTMIVQYNVAPSAFLGGDRTVLDRIGPFPLEVGSDRVSVEEAPLRPTRPDHFLLLSPNRITAADYEGWVQERGLYFARIWDARYTPLWETADPGEKPLLGATLYARHGRGIYIFTPLSWFRQLPTGIPGAYRIFANFLSAGKTAVP
jgi:hypothetical protein